MKQLFFVITLLVLAVMAPFIMAQEMTVTDSDDNVLMQVNDEGDAGSLTLPQNAAAPADTAGKLYNAGGVLFWDDVQLGGWTRTGTNVHLTSSSDNVGIGVADPDARLEVNGQIKITGGSPGEGKVLTSDAAGLATWKAKPQAAFTGGNMYDLQVTANAFEYQNVKSLTMTTPASGKVIVSASGTISWESANWDVLLGGILRNSDPNSSWSAENELYSYEMILTDYNCSDPTDQYTSFSTQRGFNVGAGTQTFTMWCNKYSSSAKVGLFDINMTAMYFPN